MGGLISRPSQVKASLWLSDSDKQRRFLKEIRMEKVSLGSPQVGKAGESMMTLLGAAGLTPLLPCHCYVNAHLSASSSRGGVPWSQFFTIHAVSKAARKPRAQPVPIGQNGYKEKRGKILFDSI